jgi:hypothetical protein
MADSESKTVTAALLDEIVATIGRWVALGQAEREAIALWVLHTHAFSAAETTPYLSITSAEKESGKTRLLEVLRLLVAKPWLTGRTTVAALVRKVDRDQPTLLLDESDTAFRREREYSEALRGVLNTGYERSGSATLCVPAGNGFTTQDFLTFCPKAIAGIGRLPDTVESRSIPIRMRRRLPGEEVQKLRRRDAAAVCQPVLQRAEAWASEMVDLLRSMEPQIPDELGDRAADVWEPLIATADLARGTWPARARAAAKTLSGSSRHEDTSLGTQLLFDLHSMWQQRTKERLPTGEMLRFLRGVEESPWGELDGRSLSPTRLAALLKPFDIKPEHWREGQRTVRGYHRAAFDDAFLRYLADPSTDRHIRHGRSADGTTPSIEPAQPTPTCRFEQTALPLDETDVPTVPAQAGPTETPSTETARPHEDEGGASEA